MPRILVVYYSRSGHTRQIAHEIAAALDADLEEISDPTPRSDAARDPSRYDVVVVGTPIWNASLASPVRSYLYRYGYAIRSFAFFCTCGGFAIERVFRQMAVETGQAPVARLAVRERELANPARAALVARFAGEIRAAARAAARQSA
jgi:menaquinone-dependent protoporphyrinogen IX oxidase